MTITTFQGNQAGDLTGTQFASIHDDIIKPQIYWDMVQEHPDQYSTMYGFFDMMGGGFPVQDDPYTVFFDDWKWEYLTTSGNVTLIAAGAEVTLTLDTNDHWDSGTKSFPRIGQNVFIDQGGGQFINGVIRDKDTSTPGAHTIDIEPADSGDAFATSTGTTIPTGTTIAYGGISAPYGSGQPRGVSSGEIVRDFGLEIFEETFKTQGHLYQKPVWVNVNSANGKQKSLISKEVFDTEFRLMKGKGMNMLIGQADNNADLNMGAGWYSDWGSVGEAGALVPKTQGMWQWGYALGTTDPTPPATFTFSTFKDIKDAFTSEGFSANLACIMGGSNIIQDISEEIEQRGGWDATDRTRGMVNDAMKYRKNEYGFFTRGGWESTLDFKSVTIGQMKYLLMESTEFSDEKTLAQLGFKDNAIVFPVGVERVAKSAGGSKMFAPNIGIMYLSGNGYSRKSEIWKTGGANGTYTSTEDAVQYNYRCHEGLFCVRANQFYLLTGN